MTSEIFYFSGTGNSLYVARQLSLNLSNVNLTPIISSLNKEQYKTDADIVGFIFPLHAFTLPAPVKQFLEKLQMKSSSYLFAVATRGGSPCKVFTHINNILKNQGKQLDAQFFINMPNNYLPAFDVATSEEIAQLEHETDEQIELITQVLQKKQPYKEKDPHGSFLEENILFPILTQVFHKTGYFNTQNNFYSNASCTGCGVCEKVCLSGKIKMTDNRPEWNKCVNCTYCFSCIHYCPAKAIQIKKSKTELKGRYHHKSVRSGDIAAQKR
ncbi:MAG: EFR1 family ferrodoxin [Mobilitalea sp.]